MVQLSEQVETLTLKLFDMRQLDYRELVVWRKLNIHLMWKADVI